MDAFVSNGMTYGRSLWLMEGAYEFFFFFFHLDENDGQSSLWKSMYSHWKFLVSHQFDSFQVNVRSSVSGWVFVIVEKVPKDNALFFTSSMRQGKARRTAHYSACVALDDSKIKYNWTGKTLGRIEEHIIWDNLIFPISLLC
ncbi:hypothetical protein K1719_031615 [Acacia pycnantha]|nr:hypothetical protein K1719_031615 [Acacia pycnantha]